MNWETAIKDAEQMISDEKNRIKLLKKSVKFFRECIKNNTPWPIKEEETVGGMPIRHWMILTGVGLLGLLLANLFVQSQ